MERMSTEEGKEWEMKLSAPLPEDDSDDFTGISVIGDNSTIY